MVQDKILFILQGIHEIPKKGQRVHVITRKPYNTGHQKLLWFNVSTPTMYAPSFKEI